MRWLPGARSARADARRDSSRPFRTTVAPSWLSSTAVARPIPDDAPVTSTVFPVKSSGLIIKLTP